MRTWYQGEEMPEATDLDVVRQILPDTPYGQGVRQILKPMPLVDGAFEGVLARDPDDPEVWGIAYSSESRPERQRFTIAHELGHFVLHRNLKPQFNCDQQSVQPNRRPTLWLPMPASRRSGMALRCLPRAGVLGKRST